jgi:hypothetical protein
MVKDSASRMGSRFNNLYILYYCISVDKEMYFQPDYKKILASSVVTCDVDGGRGRGWVAGGKRVGDVRDRDGIMRGLNHQVATPLPSIL